MGGRIEAGPRRAALRKLQIVCLPPQPEEFRYVAVDAGVITLNSLSIPWTNRSPFLNTANTLLLEVEELVIVLHPYSKRFDGVAKHIFPALPSLRKMTISKSGESRLAVCDLLGELFGEVEGGDPGAVQCPMLEEVSLLHCNLSDPPESEPEGRKG